MTEPTWDYGQLETAMCLYEAMGWGRDTWSEKGDIKPDAPQWAVDLDRTWDNNGSFGMMHIAAHLAFPVSDLWAALDEGEDLTDGLSFDCEFMPEMLEHIEWSKIDGHQIGTLKPNALESMKAWRDAAQAQFAEAAFKHRFPTIEAYKAELAKAAGRRWGYPELITEEGVDSLISEAFEARTDPDKFAEEQGEEHDLIEPDPITLQDLKRIYR